MAPMYVAARQFNQASREGQFFEGPTTTAARHHAMSTLDGAAGKTGWKEKKSPTMIQLSKYTGEKSRTINVALNARRALGE